MTHRMRVARTSQDCRTLWAAIQAADDGPNSSDSSDDADGNTDVEVQTDAEDEDSDDSSTSEDDRDVSARRHLIMIQIIDICLFPPMIDF